MGTNYYHIEKPCPTCGKGEEKHIGKSSMGWVFALHIIPEDDLNTLNDWKSVLQTGRIVDEYGNEISYQEMLDCITNRSHPNGLLRRNDDEWCAGHGEGTWDYIEGEFS